MAILINEDTRVLIQGITGRVGSFQTKIMLDYGTNVVAGVTPGKGGQVVHGVPVYGFVADAVAEHHVDASFGFVPGQFAKSAALEVIDAGIPFHVLTAEGVPDQDMLTVINYARYQDTTVLGPDTPGLIAPGKCKLGVHPDRMFKEGHVGLLSKSGALSYEVSKTLTEAGIGQSTVVGIGGGPFWGLSQLEVLRMFQDDRETKVVVLLGEVGGTMEQEAAAFIGNHMEKPVVALIVGRAAPPGKQMGHAGAIIEGESGTAEAKIEILKEAGVHVAYSPKDIPAIIGGLGVELDE